MIDQNAPNIKVGQSGTDEQRDLGIGGFPEELFLVERDGRRISCGKVECGCLA